MSSIFFESSNSPVPLISGSTTTGGQPGELAAEDGRGSQKTWPAWLPVFLVWLALAIPSLSAAMALIRLLMENLPPLSPTFPILLWALGLVWLLYLVPTLASVILTWLHSPRAIFFWRFSAGTSLAIASAVGLGLVLTEPMILDELWGWLNSALPALVAWLNQNRLWAIPPLAAALLMALLVGLNAAWLVHLCRSARVAAVLGRPERNLPPPPPSVSPFREDFQTGSKDGGPRPVSTALVVYLVMIIYIGLSGLSAMVSRFYFLSPYLEQQSFLGFVFNDIGFYLVLALVPLLAAIFGLASLGRSSRRRSPLPAALLAICLMAVYSLVSSYLSLIHVFKQLSQPLLILNLAWSVVYLGLSIYFLVQVLQYQSTRSSRG